MADPSIERFRAVISVAYSHLEERRQEINDLNVFPVAEHLVVIAIAARDVPDGIVVANHRIVVADDGIVIAEDAIAIAVDRYGIAEDGIEAAVGNGNAAANERLSLKRAGAVSNYLRQTGKINPGRVLSPSAMGEGGTAPDIAAPTNNEEARRVVVRVVTPKTQLTQ